MEPACKENGVRGEDVQSNPGIEKKYKQKPRMKSDGSCFEEEAAGFVLVLLAGRNETQQEWGFTLEEQRLESGQVAESCQAQVTG